jgi:hypothetical protein
MSAVQIRQREEKGRAAVRGVWMFVVFGSLLILTATIASATASARAVSGCQSTSPAVVSTNSKAEQRASKLLKSTSYTPLSRTFTPKPTSTKQFTGYETITVKSPKGTAPVVGYFKLTGNTACSVVVTSARVALSQNAYLVALKFPGSQGKTGSLKVTLISR